MKRGGSVLNENPGSLLGENQHLKGLTPYEAICKAWTAERKQFTLDPLHQMPGLNI